MPTDDAPRSAAPGRLPRYARELPYGWVLGHFAVRDLLRFAPETVLDLRLHGDLAPERADELRALAARSGVPVRRDDVQIEAKRSKGTARVLATFAKRWRALDDRHDHLALVSPREPGNLGTTLRTALGLGVRDVAIVGSGDPWSPHATRASLGATFALRLCTFRDLSEYRSTVPDRTPWLLAGDGEHALDEVGPAAGPRTIVAGPEWPGLDQRERALGRTVRIPMRPEVESLNVAVAVGIALHALARGPS